MKERKKKEHIILCEFLHPKKKLLSSRERERDLRARFFDGSIDFYCERRFALRHVVQRTEKNEEEDPPSKRKNGGR